jgi:kynureninase
VTIDVTDGAAVYAELELRGILGDFRPGGGIRLGAHFFTTDDEIRFAVQQIVEIVETGAFERHLGAVARH